MKSSVKKTWVFRTPNPDKVREISVSLGISEVLAAILVNRNIGTVKEARDFLNPDLSQMHNPFLLPGMEKAVLRTRLAMDRREKILIYGDRDVDGITSLSILVRTLKGLGADVSWVVPSGGGYGLHNSVLESFARENVRLVITVDCGTSAVQEINFAKGLGMDVIVTDHHLPPEILPEACAIINPNLKESAYPMKSLAGCLTAFKLAYALMYSYGKSFDREKKESCLQSATLFRNADETDDPRMNYFLEQQLDLVTLGTIADIVPLYGENRAIVKQGLRSLLKTSKPGLKKLLEKCELLEKKRPGENHREVTAKEVSWGVTPLLNAAGRFDKAEIAAKLLTTEDSYEASKLADEIYALNEDRRILQKNNQEQFYELAMKQCDLENDKLIFIAAEGLEHGVTGIVASRMAREYGKPSVLLIIKDSGVSGSSRSVPGFNIVQALDQCRDLLLKYGGHPQAAGLSLSPDKVEDLRKRLKAIAESELTLQAPPQIEVDLELSSESITKKLLQEISHAEPFGEGNPSPVFALKDAIVEDAAIIGPQKDHLRLRLNKEGKALNAVGWGMGEHASFLKNGALINVLFHLELNRWKSHETLQLELLDIAPKEN